MNETRPANTATALGLDFTTPLVRAVAERRVKEPEALFVDIYNTAREQHAPNLPVISSERYLPRGFVEAVQVELQRMTTPPPPPPPKPEPTLDDLLAKMVSRVTGGKVDEIAASQGAIREHLRKVDGLVTAVEHRLKELETMPNRLKTLEGRPHVDVAGIMNRLKALEERPTQTVQISQLEARLSAKFDELKTELEETVMELMSAEPSALPPEEPEHDEKHGQNGKFRISVCDPLVNKYARRILTQAPANVKLFFENMDALPPNTLGTRHFVIISGRARKQWVTAFRSALPTERVISIDRLGTTNLLRTLQELSNQPYFSA